MSNNLGAGPATVGGQAARISAADKAMQVTLDEGAAMLQAQGGTLTAAVTITRKDTGKVEHYTLTMSDPQKGA